MDLQLTPQDKDLISLYGEDLDAATEAVLARLTAELRPKLRLQVKHEIDWNATYRDILAREAAAHHYLLCQPASNSTPTRPVYAVWRVLVGDVEDFAKEHHLDKAKLLKLAVGELQEYKGWIAYPLASGKYCDNRRPKPATEHPSLAEGLPGPVVAATRTDNGTPLKPAPVFLQTQQYKPQE
jgi:hypothetical protein